MAGLSQKTLQEHGARLAYILVFDPEEKIAYQEDYMLGWIIFGLIVGVLAKLIMPGRDPGGVIVTILIGIAGAVIGGVVGRGLGFYGPAESAGWLMALLGSIFLLWAHRRLSTHAT
jgi:uncharacterized membrane protein YeaQ/YmgE (transglycosylase-associated protein family)